MFGYSLILQALYVVAWIILLVGSVVLLRRGYASAAVSMLLGAAIASLMTIFSLCVTVCLAAGWFRGTYPSKMMMLAGLVSVVGLFLFALGFLQLARMTRREG